MNRERGLVGRFRRGISTCCMCFRRHQNDGHRSDANERNFTDPADIEQVQQPVPAVDTDVNSEDLSHIQYVPVHPADLKNLESFTIPDMASTNGQTQLKDNLSNSIPDSLEDAIMLLNEMEHEQIEQDNDIIFPDKIKDEKANAIDDSLVKKSPSIKNGTKLKNGISKFFENIKNRFTGESKSESKVKKTQNNDDATNESKAKSESHMVTKKTDGCRIANYRTPSVELILWKEELDKNDASVNQSEPGQEMTYNDIIPCNSFGKCNKSVQGDIIEDNDKLATEEITEKINQLETKYDVISEVIDKTTMRKHGKGKNIKCLKQPDGKLKPAEECSEMETKHSEYLSIEDKSFKPEKTGMIKQSIDISDNMEYDDLVDKFAVKFVNKLWREACLELTYEMDRDPIQYDQGTHCVIDDDLLDVLVLKCVHNCIIEAKIELENEYAATQCIDMGLALVNQACWTENF